MHPSVAQALVPFNAPIEGVVPWMYVDRKNLVTTGMGNLINPIENALKLQWHHLAGQADKSKRPFDFTGPIASPQEVYAAWQKVKNAGVSSLGGGKQAYLTDLRLDDAGLDAVVHNTVTNNEAYLKARIPHWDEFPADAQLALLSMAYAMGPGYAERSGGSYFPKFMAAVNAWPPRFDVAAQECTMQPDSDPALHRRNVANKAMFMAAQTVMATGTPIEDRTWSLAQISDLVTRGEAALANLFTAGALEAAAAARAVEYAAYSTGQLATFRKSKPLGALFWVALGVVGFGAFKVLQAKRRARHA